MNAPRAVATGHAQGRSATFGFGIRAPRPPGARKAGKANAPDGPCQCNGAGTQPHGTARSQAPATRALPASGPRSSGVARPGLPATRRPSPAPAAHDCLHAVDDLVGGQAAGDDLEGVVGPAQGRHGPGAVPLRRAAPSPPGPRPESTVAARRPAAPRVRRSARTAGGRGEEELRRARRETPPSRCRAPRPRPARARRSTAAAPAGPPAPREGRDPRGPLGDLGRPDVGGDVVLVDHDPGPGRRCLRTGFAAPRPAPQRRRRRPSRRSPLARAERHRPVERAGVEEAVVQAGGQLPGGGGFACPGRAVDRHHEARIAAPDQHGGGDAA